VTEPRDIDALLDEVVTLPSLPSTVAHITELVNDPDCSLTAVGRAISVDPAIALKTLRLVNSAYYGLRNKVSSVEQAVVLLGLKVIKNLVFTATVFDTLKSGVDAFLRHSVSCGMAMRVLAENGNAPGLDEDASEEGFAVGLLHDVGKIIFEQFVPEDFEKVRERAVRSHVPWHEAEQEIIGVDHAAMGARLAANWKLPGNIVAAIAGHHDLAKCADPELKGLAAALSAADYICTAAGAGSHDGAAPVVAPDVWPMSRIVSENVPSLLDKYFRTQSAVEELIQIAT